MGSQSDAADRATGTTLANEPAVAEIRPADVWRRQRDKMLVEESGPVRVSIVLMGGLVQLALVAILVRAGFPTWRVLGLIGVYVVFALVQTRLHRRLRHVKQLEHAFIRLNLTA